MSRKIRIITDESGKKIVVINEVIFKGKRGIDWDAVELYLKQYVGELYDVLETEDRIYIGSDLPDEYTGSENRKRLKGANAKAKANAVQGLGELIIHATGKRYKDNFSAKHDKGAKYGWYRYNTRFALPVYDEEELTGRFNTYSAELLVRHDKNGKKYLYDVINIKKMKTPGL